MLRYFVERGDVHWDVPSCWWKMKRDKTLVLSVTRLCCHDVRRACLRSTRRLKRPKPFLGEWTVPTEHCHVGRDFDRDDCPAPLVHTPRSDVVCAADCTVEECCVAREYCRDGLLVCTSEMVVLPFRSLLLDLCSVFCGPPRQCR